MEMNLDREKLPPNWTESNLEPLIGDGGIFCDGDWVESKDQDPSGEVRLIQLADIGDAQFKNKSARFLTYQKSKELHCTFLEKGDILIARMPDPLGRACKFPLQGAEKFVTVVDVCILRIRASQINNDYLLWGINSPSFRNEIDAYKSGSTRKRISRKNLAKIRLPIAPLPEQRMIVDKIESLFSELDNAVDNIKTAMRKLKVYRQAVLQQAFTGELTKQWREEHPDLPTAEELLEKIKAQREEHYQNQLRDWKQAVKDWEEAGKKGKKPSRPKKPAEVEPLSEEELKTLPALPGDWLWSATASIGLIEMGQSPPGNSYNTDGIGIPLINGPVEFGPTDYSKTRKLKWTTKPTKLCEEGDLLLCVRGSTTGRQNISGFAACIGRGVCAIKSEISSEYVKHYFKYSRSKIFKMGGGSTFPNVSNSQIMSFPIPIASMEEQRQIVVEVERRLSVCEKVESELEAALKRSGALRRSILKRAFEGRLLNERELEEARRAPDWEPADELLRRLAAERK